MLSHQHANAKNGWTFDGLIKPQPILRRWPTGYGNIYSCVFLLSVLEHVPHTNRQPLSIETDLKHRHRYGHFPFNVGCGVCVTESISTFRPKCSIFFGRRSHHINTYTLSVQPTNILAVGHLKLIPIGSSYQSTDVKWFCSAIKCAWK